MTVEEVLAVLVESHRWQSEWDPGDYPDALLTLEMTVAEWRDA